MIDTVLTVEDLKKHFPVKAPAVQRIFSRAKPVVHAVDGLNFILRHGEILGLVGESGCGKTTVGRLVVRLLKPTAGRIVFEGVDITNLPALEEHFMTDFLARQFRRLARGPRGRPGVETRVRGAELLWSLRRRMQIIFQDPHAALNPAMTIGQSIMDPLLLHKLATPQEARSAALEIMTEVGLSPAEQLFAKYPADLSGGQKQRAVIARAMVLRPSFIVADEPVAMLDMSIRARILELMLKLKEKHGLTYLFITHDLATAKLICNRIAIMYLGRIVEIGPAEAIFRDPKHPYTKALLAAVPVPEPGRRRVRALPRGEVPDAIAPPAGCRFHPRCPVAMTTCGWEGRDFIDFLEERRLVPERAGAEAAAFGPIDEWTADGPLAMRKVQDDKTGLLVERIHAALREAPEPLAHAVEEVIASKDRVIVRFRAPDTLEPKQVESRTVECLLY